MQPAISAQGICKSFRDRPFGPLKQVLPPVARELAQLIPLT